MKAFVRSLEAISPQETFRSVLFPESLKDPEKEYFQCIHPDYRQFIPPTALRRMSPVIRMGLAASRVCLEQAGIEKPGAILVGSGLGCVQDTVRFLDQMIENREQLLNPTAFIQSTHNTVAGQIALMLDCREDNLTFSQKSLSFETALMEALMLLEEGERGNVLVGGIDELVESSFRLLVEAGCARIWNGGNLLEGSREGSVAGEGASFFLLSGEAGESGVAGIRDLRIHNRCAPGELPARIDAFLAENGLDRSTIDLLVSGMNGDTRYDGHYHRIHQLFEASIVTAYKHLVGEYDTASAFALYLGCRIIQQNQVPESVLLKRAERENISHVLVLHFSKEKDLSLLLLSDPTYQQ